MSTWRAGGEVEWGSGMKRSKQWLRMGLVAGAGLVLLVTVLPQMASATDLGTPAHRLATSTVTGALTGTVTGTVTITGAPKGFAAGLIGAGACPDTGSTGFACQNPDYALSANGTYSLQLKVGKWRLAGFYELGVLSGAFLGTSTVVTVTSGNTTKVNVTVPYRKPAAVKGTISVTGVPSGIQIDELAVLLCPSYAPYQGGTTSIACVNDYASGSSGDSAPYQIAGLPPGAWFAYPTVCTKFGCDTNAKAGKSITLVGGTTKIVNVTTPFPTPASGLLTGKVTVTGAPTGFADPVAVMACKTATTNCQTETLAPGGAFTLLLANGTWSITGLYLAAPFYNEIAGATKSVAITGGHTTTLDLSVPYQVLGEAAGAVNVIGVPSGVTVKSYTVLACPAAFPWAGGVLRPPECVNEYSGPAGYGLGAAAPATLEVRHPAVAPLPALAGINRYQLPTLTKGTWILYPGYQTVFGAYTDPSGTKVSIASGKTTTQNLTVPYHKPSVGVVAGTVSVVGSPGSGVASGVEACSARPTATSCPHEQEAYAQSDGSYQLTLAPGTWWVAGFVEFFPYFGGTMTESISTPVDLTVKAGSLFTKDFTVVVSP